MFRQLKLVNVGVEIGGTFTDVVCIDENGTLIESFKILSTPEEPEKAAIQALLTVKENVGVLADFIHGSTVATNAVIQRKGADTALIVTRGFRDLLEIQRHDRADLYDIQYQKPIPLVRRSKVFEVTERIDAAGNVINPLDESEVQEIANTLAKLQIDSLAICLLHSYVNP